MSLMLIDATRQFRLRAGRPAALMLSVVLAAVAGCARGEVVTPDSIREARGRWERANVRDYDLEWASSGPSDTHYAVKVRDGQVQTVESIMPDGRRYVVKPANPKFYGVEGLFMVIADELAQLDQPTPFGRPKGTTAVLHFTPDPKFGYPRSYRRDVVGAPTALAIDVLRFTPTSPPGSAPAK
jgi:hypothetical protein